MKEEAGSVVLTINYLIAHEQKQKVAYLLILLFVCSLGRRDFLSGFFHVSGLPHRGRKRHAGFDFFPLSRYTDFIHTGEAIL